MKIIITALILFFPLFAFAQIGDVEEYIAEHHEFAQEVETLYGVPASICLAQAILESAAGEAVICRMAKNHFSIRDGNKWRKYANAHESYLDYGLFFRESSLIVEWPYGSAPQRWAEVLTASWYAGDNQDYTAEIMSIINQYKLTKYDR